MIVMYIIMCIYIIWLIKQHDWWSQTMFRCFAAQKLSALQVAMALRVPMGVQQKSIFFLVNISGWWYNNG